MGRGVVTYFLLPSSSLGNPKVIDQARLAEAASNCSDGAVSPCQTGARRCAGPRGGYRRKAPTPRHSEAATKEQMRAKEFGGN